MPPWKVKRAQGQARGWSEVGMRRALGVVADLNADVKGAAVDAEHSLQRAVRALAQARELR
jgi:DNA polymerase-3 subunit delta